MPNEQIVNQPSLYLLGGKITNDATTPNNIINVAAAQLRDSTNVYDMNLGNYNGATGLGTANSSTSCSIVVNGVNGLDTGTVAASTPYFVFVISDPLNRPQYAVSLLLSLSSTAPLMPQGYAVFRRIGAIRTDGSSHILLQYQRADNGNTRYMQYDAPIAVTVTSSGTSATYSAMDLSTGVPVTNFGKVRIKYKWTNNAPADALNFTPSGATGDQETVLGIVAAVAQEASFEILPLIVSSLPKVSYKTSAGTLNNVWVCGYEDLL